MTRRLDIDAFSPGDKKTNRGKYKCGRCGQLKQKHSCEYQVHTDVCSIGVQAVVDDGSASASVQNKDLSRAVPLEIKEAAEEERLNLREAVSNVEADISLRQALAETETRLAAALTENDHLRSMYTGICPFPHWCNTGDTAADDQHDRIENFLPTILSR